MSTLLFLILFPVLAAVALLVFKNDKARGAIVIISAIAIAAVSIVFAVQFFSSNELTNINGEWITYLMMGIEVAIAIFIFILGAKHKKYGVCLLVAIQAPLMIWFELTIGHNVEVANNIFVDKLAIIMALIIGIIGSLICIYALGYMKDFAHHHHDQKDRRPLFFFLLFIFLSAMFGLVFSNSLIWLYFFWEITTLCSFLLIGYTKTEEAVKNSFKALIMNLAGGLAFVFAIIFAGFYSETLELSTLLERGVMGDGAVVLIAMFLGFAGITKAAQMPFSGWLLGAMVAPTPTSALLHSSTMVKAGVYLIVRLAPVLGWNSAGIMIMLVGGITFFFASCAAISQSNAKKVLAYSTVANLGLIVACGGIGTPEAAWTAVMLIIFHAVAKSLLFLCVGTAEHNIGSRDIEAFDGLFNRMPKLAVSMCIGICGMFLAPFGMLLSKWAAMKSFVDSGNIVLVIFLVFGSAVTLFFWTKWLGKITAIMAQEESIESNVHKDERAVIGILSFLTIAVCLCFMIISEKLVIPYISSAFVTASPESIAAVSQSNMIIMVCMMALIVLLPIVSFGRTKKKIVPIYMAGVNAGDNVHFHGSMGKDVAAGHRNWYMENIFGERKMTRIGDIASIVTMTSIFSLVLAQLIFLFINIFKGGVI